MSKEKRLLTKTEKRVLIVMIAATVVAAVIFMGLLYINDYYRPTEKAKKAIFGNEVVSVTETEDYYLFEMREDVSKTGVGDGQGIIFYPGGRVDEVAYAPLLLELAEEGYDVYLVKMPAKLAIFGMNAAAGIMKEAEEITGWTMMGHSLGGAMAASFCATSDDKIDNLVLLAAYSTVDLSKLDIDVYSFYGSEDKVLNMQKYEAYSINLPTNVVETVIAGGNHAYYAHYGEQDKDGKATITRAEQQEIVLDVFLTIEKEELGIES